MSHEMTVNAVDADIELDYSDIWENIEDSVSDLARDAIRDYAWDEVCGEVEEMIDYHGRSSEDVEQQISDLLENYISVKDDGRDACGTGRSFEKAVGLAVASSDVVVSRSVANVDEDLSVQKRLADLEYKMNTVLDALFVLGNRAAGVDNRADG